MSRCTALPKKISAVAFTSPMASEPGTSSVFCFSPLPLIIASSLKAPFQLCFSRTRHSTMLISKTWLIQWQTIRPLCLEPSQYSPFSEDSFTRHGVTGHSFPLLLSWLRSVSFLFPGAIQSTQASSSFSSFSPFLSSSKASPP